MKSLLTALALTIVLATPVLSEAEPSKNPFELNNATAEDLMTRCFFPQELAEKVLDLRDSLGGFQSWDDLKELNLDQGMMSILASEATISGITTDCGC